MDAGAIAKHVCAWIIEQGNRHRNAAQGTMTAGPKARGTQADRKWHRGSMFIGGLSLLGTAFCQANGLPPSRATKRETIPARLNRSTEPMNACVKHEVVQHQYDLSVCVLNTQICSKPGRSIWQDPTARTIL